jgi:hypothetical protein
MSDTPSLESPGGRGLLPPPVVADLPPSYPPAAQDASEPSTPWLSIWTRPRATLRQILATDPRRGIFRLAALGGISEFLAMCTHEGIGDTYSIPVLLALSLAGGTVLGILGILIFTAVIAPVGRWLRGRGGSTEVMAALAWANVPAVWGLLLWLPRAALLGAETFHPIPAIVQGNPQAFLFYGLLQFLQIVIGVWGFAITLKCLGEAHGFSAWRAFLTLVVAGLIVILPIALILLALETLS